MAGDYENWTNTKKQIRITEAQNKDRYKFVAVAIAARLRVQTALRRRPLVDDHSGETR